MRPRLLTAASAILAADLALVFVTGRIGLVAEDVGSLGFALRALALGVLLALRFAALPRRESRIEKGRLALVLVGLGALVQLQASGGRLSGVDSISYYVFLRSMVKDGDFDLANEYSHYQMLDRPPGDLAMPTKTGLRRSIYSVGPAVVWTPFFLLGDGVARLEGAVTGEAADLSGYGRHHVNAVALGSFLYGWAALLIVHALLRRHFCDATATAVVLALWLLTFFHWYLVVQPTYAHNASTLLAALALWLWDRDREGVRSAWGHFFLGAVLGLAMCVRWQNGVLLLLPGIELALGLRQRGRAPLRLVRDGALVAAGVAIGAFPQMAAWKAIYDMWILPYPPQGTDFLRLDHPWILETLFSSRHGLLSWTPVVWLGYIGFIPLLRRRPALALPLLAPLLLMTYVNFCVGDWWGGASFSNRRFDSVLPLLALGGAAAADAIVALVRAWPGPAVVALGIPFLAFNLATAAARRQGTLPGDDTAHFAVQAGAAAAALERGFGFPTTWPASWIFAWRHDLTPDRYDLVVGRYLFYKQNSLGARYDIGVAGDGLLLAEGWSGIETRAGRPARRVVGRARLLAPLDVAEDIELRFRSSGAGRDVAVAVNGRPAGIFRAESDWDQRPVFAPQALWHRELNEVVIEGDDVWLTSVEFVRSGRRR